MSKSLSATLPPGTNLTCVTIKGNNIRGNVVATDENFGALVIRDNSSSGNIYVINLRYLTELKVLPSSSSDVRPPPSHLPVSLPKVRKRLEGSIEARRNQVQALGVNVPPHAQQLFNHIRKLYSDTQWNGPVIVVLGDTWIHPPYTPESVSGKGTEIIRKLMKKRLEGTA